MSAIPLNREARKSRLIKAIEIKRMVRKRVHLLPLRRNFETKKNGIFALFFI